MLPLSTSYLLLLVPFSHAQHHTILIDLFRGWPPPSPLLPHCCFCPAPLSPTGSGLHSHFLPIAVPLHVCAGSVSAPPSLFEPNAIHWPLLDPFGSGARCILLYWGLGLVCGYLSLAVATTGNQTPFFHIPVHLAAPFFQVHLPLSPPPLRTRDHYCWSNPESCLTYATAQSTSN